MDAPESVSASNLSITSRSLAVSSANAAIVSEDKAAIGKGVAIAVAVAAGDGGTRRGGSNKFEMALRQFAHAANTSALFSVVSLAIFPATKVRQLRRDARRSDAVVSD